MVTDDRRFGGMARLYGRPAAERLFAAHVLIAGIGGVGSWTAEALARSGVGRLTLVDLDMVAESNTNRQIHALEGAYGQAKVAAMAARIALINPACQVQVVEDFVTEDNVADLCTAEVDVTVDAIDQTKIKAALVAHCRAQGQAVVVAGAAGGKCDPTQIRVADLSQTTQDPLLARVRSILRQSYGFPRGEKKKFAVPAVYSLEPRRQGDEACAPTQGGLNCAGYGSSVAVTATFGLVAAAQAMQAIIDA